MVTGAQVPLEQLFPETEEKYPFVSRSRRVPLPLGF
jgi:hypothetical protein